MYYDPATKTAKCSAFKKAIRQIIIKDLSIKYYYNTKLDMVCLVNNNQNIYKK